MAGKPNDAVYQANVNRMLNMGAGPARDRLRKRVESMERAYERAGQTAPRVRRFQQ